MKQLRRLILTLVSLILVLSSLSLCGCGRQFTVKNMRITDKKTGVSYEYVSSVYEAKMVSDTVYATWKQNDVKVRFYQIEGLDPAEWLASEFGDVIYSGSEMLPELADFGATSALICDTTGSIAISIHDIRDKAEIDAIVDAYLNGETSEYPATTASAYSVKFESDSVPGLYYSLLLLFYADGTYLYDRYAGRCVNVGTLFDEYVYS